MFAKVNLEEPEELCIVCQAIDLQHYLFQDLCPGTIKLGVFQDILEKSKCPLCRLIIRALSVNSEDYWEKGIYPSEVCYLGRKDGLSRPSVLEVWFDTNSDTLPKGMYGHNTIRGEILLIGGDIRIAERRPTNQGRLIGSSTELPLLREWLSNCENRHGHKCEALYSNKLSMDPRPLILVDVERRRLVKCKPGCRYIALSYVWGKTVMLQTLKANLAELQEDGALTVSCDQIPRVIKEAMEVVAGLGEKYLWVDTLCLVQDGADKLGQISRMDAIYGSAILTIVASAGCDASAGLPGIHPGPRSSNQGCENVHGMDLINKLPELSKLLEKSRWESRAWTFQERIFSRRCLYFTDAQVYFQCRSCVCREDILGEYSTSSLIASGAVNPLEREVWTTDAAYSPIFNIYEGLVKSYCRRELSYQSDILNAFAGIMSAFHERFGWRFLSALPEEALNLALLWKPMSSSRPRFTSVTETLEPFSTTFPSWCWTAWVGDFYWDPWRTSNYAGNDIHLISEIKVFKVKDMIGFRSVQTKQRSIKPRLHSVILLPTSCSLVEEEVITESSLLPEGILSGLPVLYFWAQATRLDRLFLSFDKHHPQDDNRLLSSKLKHYFFNQGWIYDTASHHCGTLIGIESWPPDPAHETSKYELLLLSRCHQKIVTAADIEANLDRLPPEHPSHQEYYDEIFDTCYYTPTEDWAMNIMLVEWKGDYAVRVAVGQIHADAWENSNPQRKFVRLA